MTARRSLALALPVLGILASGLLPQSAAADPPRRIPRYQVGPRQLTSGDTTWERLPVRYVDVRVIAAALGAPVLPTEWDVWQMRMGGGAFGGAGMRGGFGGGGFGGGLLGDPSSNSLITGPGAAFRGALFADPSTNAIYYRYGPSR